MPDMSLEEGVVSLYIEERDAPTFQGMLAFQQRQASDRCCMMVRACVDSAVVQRGRTKDGGMRGGGLWLGLDIHKAARLPSHVHSYTIGHRPTLFWRTPSGIMSRMSATTAARSSRSKCDSARCFVTCWWGGCMRKEEGEKEVR